MRSTITFILMLLVFVVLLILSQALPIGEMAKGVLMIACFGFIGIFLLLTILRL